MGLQLEIETTNAAFYVEGDEDQDYAPGSELARILRWLADRIDGEGIDGLADAAFVLKDESGNKVGTADWEADDESWTVADDDEDEDDEEEEEEEDEDDDDE